jgi:protoheme IX farnesyltransferase
MPTEAATLPTAAAAAGAGRAGPAGARDCIGSDWTDWVRLLKPRVMSLAVFTAACGLALAPERLPPMLALAAILAIAVGAGAAGALNQVIEAEVDARMARTAGRPLPAGRIARDEALAFALLLACGSVTVLALAANLLAAGLLAVSILAYALVYTLWLKPRTPQNIVIGGAAGAFPPVIGWAAATGSIEVAPAVLFAIIFLWTPPHFWALSLFAHADYARAGVPMLPVVAGARETRRQILVYTAALVAVSLVPVALGFAGVLYGAAAALLGAGFLRHALAVLSERQDDAGISLAGDRAAKAAFRFSITYLFALFGALALDRLVTGAGWLPI